MEDWLIEWQWIDGESFVEQKAWWSGGDGIEVACSTTHQQCLENAEQWRGAVQVAPAFVIGKKKIWKNVIEGSKE